MAKLMSFGLDKIRTITARLQRGYKAHRFSVRKLGFGSATILAMFAAPFAVHALTTDGPSISPVSEVSSQKDESGQQSHAASDDTASGSGENQTSVNIQSQGSSGSEAETEVTINGQNVPVPPSGEIHKEYTGGQNRTSVDIQVKDSGSSTNVYSDSSTSVEVNSQTYSSGDATKGDERHRQRAR